LKYYQDSLEIQRELDNDKGIASCWNNLGGLYARQGRWERALTAFSYDREIHVKMGDKAGEANALANMGALFAQQGHFNKSIEALLQSIMISREINNSRILRNALTNLGVNRVLAGNLHEALGVWSEAITIERQLDHPDLAKSTSYIEELKAIKDTTSEDPKQQSFIERIRKANVESEKGGIARKTIMRLISKAADNQDHDEGTEILAEVVGIAEEISDPKIDDYRELLRDIRSIVREERERKAIADMAQHLWEEGEKLLFSGKSFTAGLKAWEEAVVLAERIKAPDLEKMKEMLAGVRETITSAPQMEEFADIWNRGARYIQVHEDEKALPYLEQAMEYLEKNLALRLKFSKTADESEKNLRSLRERIARKKEEDHPDVVTDIGRLNEETMALVRSGNLEQALATCEKMLALETSITFPYLRTHQKLNERIRFGLEKQREGHPVQFIEEEDEARNEFDKLWTQGQELSQTGNMTKALGIFGQAIQIGEQLNIPDWEKYLREYVKIGHDVILAEARELWQKGSEMVASGELTEALPLWEKAVELTRPLKYSGQSKVENMLNKLHQAIEYERAGQPVLFLPDKKSADAVIEKLWREGEALIESGRLLDAYSKWEDATTIALQFKHQNLDTYRIALLKLKQEIIQMQNEKKGLKGLLERLGKQK